MKTNIKLNKLICIVLCFLLALAVIFGLAGCANTDTSTADSNIKTDNSTDSTTDPDIESSTDDNNENTRGLEYGFKYRTDVVIDGHLEGLTAYKSDTDTFDIDNVTLTFYFGTLWISYEEDFIENVRKTYIDVPRFELIFTDEQEENIHTVKTVEENYISAKYGIKLVDHIEEGWYEYQFYHCEDLTIPKELFCKEQGVINFIINGVDVHTDEPKHMLLSGASIKYEFIETNKVILSPDYTPADLY